MDKKELKKLLEKNKLANTLMNDESFKQGAEEILKSVLWSREIGTERASNFQKISD